MLDTVNFPRGRAEKGSQKWLRRLINEKSNLIDEQLRQKLDLPRDEQIEWLSPKEETNYREYYDEEFC